MLGLFDFVLIALAVAVGSALEQGALYLVVTNRGRKERKKAMKFLQRFEDSLLKGKANEEDESEDTS